MAATQNAQILAIYKYYFNKPTLFKLKWFCLENSPAALSTWAKAVLNGKDCLKIENPSSAAAPALR